MHAAAEKEFTIETPGCALYAVAVGDAPRRLVMLHGGPGASHDYLRPQLDRLGEARTLVYYDQRGGGRSPIGVGQAYAGVDRHVEDLETLRVQLDEPQLALCGYSWGALLALHYAVAYPENVERLLLISSAPSRGFWREQMKLRMQQAAARAEVLAWKSTLDLTDRRQRFALAVAGYFVEPRQALELTPFVVRASAEQAVWQSLGDYDLRPALSSLELPALLIHGQDDPIPLEAARETAAAIRAPLVELPACGHVPYVEQPAALFAAALPFLAV